MRKLVSILACLLSAHNVSAFAAMSTPTKNKLFSIQSTAFWNLATIPNLYSCDDKDISPALTFQNIPAKTVSLALILVDPDAPSGNFYHWILFNMPPTMTNIPEGAKNFPEGVLMGKNSFGNIKYNGPCPPKGSEHRYIFTLYALDTKLSLDEGANATDVISAMENHVLGKASITGLFKH